MAAETSKPIKVTENGNLVGMVDRKRILEAISGIDTGAPA